MRVLVIGGTGFLGRFLVPEILRLGHTVAVFHRGVTELDDSLDVELIRGDRRRLDEYRDPLRRFAPDIVLDVVPSSGRQATQLMEACRGLAGRVVVVSSIDVYRACGVLHGSEPGPLEPVPLTEESALRVVAQTYPPEQIEALQRRFAWLDTEYDKVAVERAVRDDPELRATILRLPMVYGPGDPLHRLFPIVKRIADGRPFIALQEEFARWRGPHGYVENVSQAIALATTSERATGRTYNVGEPEGLTELEWARSIADAAGWRGRFVLLPADRAPAHLRVPGTLEQHWVVDSTRIRTELGYTERVPRDEAIRRTIEWERVHPPAEYDPAQFDYAAEDAACGS